jgi:hypothetical protein
MRFQTANLKIVFCVLLAVSGIGLCVILALVFGLTGIWPNAPVPEMSVWIIYIAVALVALRVALALSMRVDRR